MLCFGARLSGQKWGLGHPSFALMHLSFPPVYVSSCVSAATSSALYVCRDAWTCQAVAQLLHLMLLPYCEVSFSAL